MAWKGDERRIGCPAIAAEPHTAGEALRYGEQLAIFLEAYSLLHTLLPHKVREKNGRTSVVGLLGSAYMH